MDAQYFVPPDLHRCKGPDPGVSMRRHQPVAASFVLATLSLIMVVPSASGATRAVPLRASHYQGAAPGSVSCSINATLKFSPKLTLSGGGTSPSTMNGKVSGCSTSYAGVTVITAKFSGSFPTSPLDCSSLSTAATSSADFTISWKGSFNGSLPVEGDYAPTYAGRGDLPGQSGRRPGRPSGHQLRR